MLKERGHYTIELSDGKKVPLIFRTWTIMRYCEKNGDMSLSDFYEAFQKGFTLKQFASLIICAAEYAAIKNNQQTEYTDENQAYELIDEMGGVSGKGFLAMLSILTDTFRQDSNGQQSTEKKREKAKP